MNIIFLLVINVLLSCNPQLEVEKNKIINHEGEFKLNQLKFDRVKSAYNDNYLHVKEKLNKKGIDINDFDLYLRAFKQEKELEIWAKKPNSAYIHIETFPICASSGKIGPKRKQGDGQVPEGFYHIDRFNPLSSFHLSLGVNYPNASDKILGNQKNLGGDIFIHGNCVTVGCLPMTDRLINQIYIYAVEAKNNGQESIPITFFPFKMNDKNYLSILTTEKNKPLYSALKHGFEYFEKHRQLPSIFFKDDGSMIVSEQ